MQAHSIKGSGGQMGGQGTKGGAGTVRRARIQILSGVLSPHCQWGIIARGSNWPQGFGELASEKKWPLLVAGKALGGIRDFTMASSNCTRITSLFILMMLSCCGVFGRAVGTSELLSREPHEATLRTDRCAELEAPWLENTQEARVDSGTRLEISMRHFSARASRGLVFPGKPLFGFVRRVYRCCQEGENCRRLKGIQGRMRGGKKKKKERIHQAKETLTFHFNFMLVLWRSDVLSGIDPDGREYFQIIPQTNKKPN